MKNKVIVLIGHIIDNVKDLIISRHSVEVIVNDQTTTIDSTPTVDYLRILDEDDRPDYGAITFSSYDIYYDYEPEVLYEDEGKIFIPLTIGNPINVHYTNPRKFRTIEYSEG